MRLAEVVRFELRHRRRAPSTWLYAALILGGSLSQALDPVRRLTPATIASELTLDGLFAVAVSVGLFGGAALRDVDARMEALLFTTPLRTRDYLGGRFLGAWLVNAALLLAIPLGYALAPLVSRVAPDVATTGPFSARALLQPWAIFLLPNMAVSGAVLFAAAVLSRRLTPVYIVGFVLWFGAMLLADNAVVFDPAGVGALETAIRGWSPAESSTRVVGLSGAVLWNRLAWLTVAGGVFGIVAGRFRRGDVQAGGASRRRQRAPDQPAPIPVHRGSIQRARAVPSFGPATAIRQTISIARQSLVETAGNRWFAGVLLLCAGWSAVLVDRTNQQPFDAPSWPATMLVTALVSKDFLVGVFILSCFYAGELVWKDRVSRVAEIMDVAPVGTGVLVLGRYLALVAMLALFLTAAMAGGIVGQLVSGYDNVEPGLYLRVLLGMDLVQAALIAALVLAVHTVVNHRYFGVLAALASLIIPFAGARLGHVMLAYGADAGWVYSDMNGFGPFLEPFVWLKVYAAGWALSLGVLTCLLWIRGSERGVRRRLRDMRRRFDGAPRRTAIAAALLIVSVGGLILSDTNVLDARAERETMLARRLAYDERYSRFAGIPQPTIERARLRVEIYPDDRAVDVAGTYWVVNRTTTPIASLHVTTNPRLATRAITFDRATAPVVVDTALGYRIHALAQPLVPGDSMRLSFAIAFRGRGFSARGAETDVVQNGTTLDRAWLPYVGYTRAGSDGTIRRDERARVETIVGTAADQIAVAQGTMRREWTEHGRRYAEYDTESPQSFTAPVFSARYAVRSAVWRDSSGGSARDVTLRVYHHPAHDRNVDTFVRSMQASLAYYTAHFGPYPGTALRIVETPRYHPEFRSYPTVLAFSEGPFIARRTEGAIDPSFFNTAHEIAHQWWSAPLRNAPHGDDHERAWPELLADYGALMVTEHTFGTKAASRMRAELRAVTPDSLRPVLAELFETRRAKGAPR